MVLFVQITKLIRGIKYPKTYCILYKKNVNVNENQKNRVFARDGLKLLRIRFVVAVQCLKFKIRK